MKDIEYKQSVDELMTHLSEQIEFLDASAKSFDAGFKGEAKRLAAVIRTLGHDTSRSKSLLGLLELKNIGFYDTATEYNQKNLLSHNGLVAMRISVGGDNPGGSYFARLDDVPLGSDRTVSFDDWWNKVIFGFKDNTITRKELILAVANKDGGTHIDPSLDERYDELSRKNALGWTYTDRQSGVSSPLYGAELESVRQIAHEVQKSIKNRTYPNYKSYKTIPTNIQIGPIKPNAVVKKKIGRNDPCFCGSNIKYKYAVAETTPNNRLELTAALREILRPRSSA